MTARTTAHLASALDDTYSQLVRVRGPDCARLCYQSVTAAIDRAEAIQSSENIACDFRRVDGYLVLAPQTPEALLDEEFDFCRSLGIAVEECTQPTLFQLQALRSLRFPRQA